MRLKAFALAAPLFGLLSPLLAGGQDDWSFNQRVLITGDWLYLRRTMVHNSTLVRRAPPFQPLDGFNSSKVLDINDLKNQWGWRTGIRGSLTYIKDETASLELSYYYIYPWEGERTIEGNGNLSYPFNDNNFTEDFFNADRAESLYKSQLQNGELNYWGHMTPQRVNYFAASWIFGGRFVYLREWLNLAFTKGMDRSHYNMHTKNQLYGLQLGGILEVNPSHKWTWSVMLKGAGFLNVAGSHVFLGDLNDTVEIRDFKKKDHWQPAVLAEAIGSLAYQWFSHLNVHIGYQALFIWGLALAPSQQERNSSTGSRIESGSNLFLDGGSVGITLGF